MSSTLMPNLASKKPTKARTLIALDFEKKKAIEEIARQQNRTPHDVMIEIISKGIQEAQEAAEYEKWVEKRVLKSLQRLETEGSNGIASEQVFDTVMARVKNRLQSHQ